MMWYFFLYSFCGGCFVGYFEYHRRSHRQAITACYDRATSIRDALAEHGLRDAEVMQVVQNRTHLLTTRAESIEQQVAHHEDAIANHKQYLTDILGVLQKLHPDDKA